MDMHETEVSFDFLGCTFQRTKRGLIRRFVREKSKRSLRARIKKITRRTNQHSMEVIIAQTTPILKGWFEYFCHAHSNTPKEIDGWVRMRLRSILRKRDKRRGAGRGWDHRRWPNIYFEKLGYFSLEVALAEKKSLLKV